MASFGQALNIPPPGGGAPRDGEGQPLAYAQAPDVTKPETPSGLPMLCGFELWVPPKPNVFSSDGMPVFEILGSDAQIVQFPVRAGRQVMCFSGAMAYMSDGMTMKVQLAGLAKAFGRLAGGGSLFQVIYTNETDQDGYIAMTPDYPGVIVPINMASCPSGKIVAMRDSFLCATVGLGDVMTDVSGGFNPASSVGGFCCNGVDFIVQTVSNGEWAFLMVRNNERKKKHVVYRELPRDDIYFARFDSQHLTPFSVFVMCISMCDRPWELSFRRICSRANRF
jgi:uncharacterized protein (AIM24 family)